MAKKDKKVLERLNKEQKQLSRAIEKLETFIFSDKFDKLIDTKEEKALMVQQLNIMKIYLNILKKREIL